MTKNELARNRIEKELNVHDITFEVGALGHMIWTPNCTIQIGYAGKGIVEVNEVETPLEDVIWEVLAVEQPVQV